MDRVGSCGAAHDDHEGALLTIAGYSPVQAFAYPGWRLTLPCGPPGGHQKGFTAANAAGTSAPHKNAYEADRHAGVAAHDSSHIHPRNPRGVYRGPAEVPPRSNASGSTNVSSSFQIQRHAGTSVAPGSFPVDYYETPEDFFFDNNSLDQASVAANPVHFGLLPINENYDRPMPEARYIYRPPARPNIVAAQPLAINSYAGVGATSTVAQPAPTPLPATPAPTVSVAAPVPISPAPAPVVNSNALIPMGDGSGNYINVSTGAIVPASQIVIGTNGQPQIAPGATLNLTSALAWFQQSTLFSGVPNYYVVGGAVLALAMLSGGKGRR